MDLGFLDCIFSYGSRFFFIVFSLRDFLDCIFSYGSRFSRLFRRVKTLQSELQDTGLNI